MPVKSIDDDINKFIAKISPQLWGDDNDPLDMDEIVEVALCLKIAFQNHLNEWNGNLESEDPLIEMPEHCNKYFTDNLTKRETY